jgi:hypothetical protein
MHAHFRPAEHGAQDRESTLHRVRFGCTMHCGCGADARDRRDLNTMSEYRQASGDDAGAPAIRRAVRMTGIRWKIARARRALVGMGMLALAACAADGPAPDPLPADTARPPASMAADSAAHAPPDETQAEPAELSGAAWTAGDTRESRTVSGAALLRDMRTARHDGFDRIVFDFGPADVPSYRISYVDRPVRQCGSGDTVPLAGDGWLAIVLEPANAHTEEGVATIRERERAPGLPTLLELKMTCDFEAMVEVVAGVTAPEPYRAFVLRDPNRLVVDIRHDGRE